MNLPRFNSEGPLFYDGSERMKARYHAMKDQGLCPGCGDEPVKGKTMCQPCLSKHNEYSKAYAKKHKNKPSDPIRGEPFPITTTKQRYRVIETGNIGVVVPCPCDNPLILEFEDGLRDAFFLRELEATSHPVTDYNGRSPSAMNGIKGRPKGLSRKTIKRMLQIRQFLETQSETVYRSAIEKAVGFNCVRTLMIQPATAVTASLESLGIVERVPAERTWVAWRLTERGKAKGEQIIKKLGSTV